MSAAEVVLQMAALGQLDVDASSVREELQTIPKQMEELRSALEAMQRLVEAEANQHGQAREALTRHEQELAMHQAGLANAKVKAAKSTTTREAESAEREKETLRTIIREKEEQILRLSESMQSMQAALEKHQAELQALTKTVEKENEGFTLRLSTLRANMEEAERARSEAGKDIPRVIRKRYDRVLAQKGSGTAVLVGEMCTACRVCVPPQLAIQIKRAQERYACPSCMRYLIPDSVLPAA